jgi:lipopolysaccharide transport system permease protein
LAETLFLVNASGVRLFCVCHANFSSTPTSLLKVRFFRVSMPLTLERPTVADAPAHSSEMVTRIAPRSGWSALNMKELWNYRELLWLFTWKDIAIRYKQTVLGAAWVIIQPLFTMVVFTVFFGWLAGLNQRLEKRIPYSLCTYCALLAWQLFAHA